MFCILFGIFFYQLVFFNSPELKVIMSFQFIDQYILCLMLRRKLFCVVVFFCIQIYKGIYQVVEKVLREHSAPVCEFSLYPVDFGLFKVSPVYQ